MDARITLRVDGAERTLDLDTRTTLLDALRERLGVTSPKKGCDHGQCGACTVLLEGRRVNSCLIFAVVADGAEVTTASGLAPTPPHRELRHTRNPSRAESQPADGDALHPVAQAFVDHDALQCGYCTPGQVCSAVGMLQELKAGWPSHVTDGANGPVEPTEDEIRERMSGNLCRCGAYTNIVAAIREVAT